MDEQRKHDEAPPGSAAEATHPGDPEEPSKHPVASGVGGFAGAAAGMAVGAAVAGPPGAVVGGVVGGAAGVAAGQEVAEERHPTDAHDPDDARRPADEDERPGTPRRG